MAKQKSKIDPINDDFDSLLDSINKEFGDGTLMAGNITIDVETFPSNIASIDVALGCKGIPRGRIIEIFGPESSGKTTTTLELIAACQKHFFEDRSRYGRVVFIDAEHALDPEWASKIGVDTQKLLISQPNSGEEALAIAQKLAKSGKVELIVVDSVAALTPKSELEGEIGDHHVGAQARMMSQAMRILASNCNKTKTTIIFINQVREKIGISYGSPEVTPGGRALKFYSSIRGSISKGSAIKHGDVVIGFRPTIKFVKNKVGPPFTKAEFDICFGIEPRLIYGIDKEMSIIDVGVAHKILKQKGSWYYYNEETLGNGASKAVETLRNNSDLCNRIKEDIKIKVFGPADIKDDFSIDDEITDERDA